MISYYDCFLLVATLFLGVFSFCPLDVVAVPPLFSISLYCLLLGLVGVLSVGFVGRWARS